MFTPELRLVQGDCVPLSELEVFYIAFFNIQAESMVMERNGCILIKFNTRGVERVALSATQWLTATAGNAGGLDKK